jgi:hypothetical protein
MDMAHDGLCAREQVRGTGSVVTSSSVLLGNGTGRLLHV